jgi:DNA-binding transcriptional ArsR family regulator
VDIDEKTYLASRFCRILGNPKTYEIVREISRRKTVTPSELANRLGRSYSTVSIHLRHLREIDVVRYEKERKGNRTLYRLRTPRVSSILSAIEKFVAESRKTGRS